MKQKHSFGVQVQCVVCGKPVVEVWAEDWQQARAGQGLCNDCQQAAVGIASQIAANEPPRKEKPKWPSRSSSGAG